MSEKPLVLIAEDEPRIATVLADYLISSGYRCVTCGDGLEALETVRRLTPSLLLLDLMLPTMDGLSVCREVRTFTQMPIIMVTARAEEIDRLLGLELGADDYICKPFSPREVVARVKAVLRRTRALVPAEVASEPSALELDEMAQAVRHAGKRLELTPTEYRLLRLFLSNRGRVFSRAQLLDLCYDPDQDVSDRAIDSHIKNLRKKLPVEAELLQSVYGVGYRYGD